MDLTTVHAWIQLLTAPAVIGAGTALWKAWNKYRAAIKQSGYEQAQLENTQKEADHTISLLEEENLDLTTENEEQHATILQYRVRHDQHLGIISDLSASNEALVRTLTALGVEVPK